MRLNCYLAESSDPFIQMMRECDSGKSSHSIKRMACRYTAQLQRSLALDNKSQSLHGNASILVEGGFEQAPETDARHYRRYCGSLRVQSWSGKPMHGQSCRLTEQPPVDMKETYGWLKAAIFLLQLRDWLLLLKTKLFGLGTMSARFYIVMSVLLAACAV